MFRLVQAVQDNSGSFKAEELPRPCRKVTIVGVGKVGRACAFALMIKRLANEIVLIDSHESTLNAEILDLQHASSFLAGQVIKGSTEYEISADSKVCIITAGFPRTVKESRRDLLQRNAEVLKHVIPPLVKLSPNTVLLIVTSPVDVMTYVAWRYSRLPHHRVIGIGTNLDTSRFRVLLSERLKVSPISVDGWIIGEHGDASVPVWSGVEVAGVRLRELNPEIGTLQDRDNLMEIYHNVLDSGTELLRLKGNATWSTASSVVDLVESIVCNRNTVQAVSTRVKGIHGIEEDIFLSLPCILGESGVTDIIVQTLSEEEIELLRHSAAVMQKMVWELTW